MANFAVRQVFEPVVQSPVRSPLAPGVGSIWSASYRFALGVLPAAIAVLTRGGAATRIGPAGNVEYGAHNLVSHSEAFDNAAWAKTNATVTPNQETAPDGAVTVDRIVFTTGTKRVVNNAPAQQAAGTTITQRIFARGAVGGEQIRVFDGWTSTTPITLTTTLTAYTVSMSAQGSSNSFFIDCLTDNATIFVWGAQLNIGALTTYVPTTTAARFLPRIEHSPVSPFSAVGLLVEGQATNLAGMTEAFDNAEWVKNAGSVSANSVISPRGDLTADKQIENTANTTHEIKQDRVTTAAPYVLSVYLKAAERSFVMLYHGTSNAAQVFNVSTGTAVGNAGLGSPVAFAIESVGGGWYRAQITVNATAATNNFRIYPLTDATTYNYLGDGTSGFYVWGAQFEAGSVATSYIPNPTTGSMVRVGDFAGGGLTGAALTDLITPTSPFTLRFCYRKAYSQASNETLFGLCAGATAGGTNQLQLVTNGTQARLIHSGGSGALTGTLTHNGTTTNVIAVSVDPTWAGPRLETNGDFSSAAWWGLDGGVSIAGGECVFASVANNTGIYRSVFNQQNKTIRITYTVKSVTAGGFRWYINGTSLTVRSAPGTYSEVVTVAALDAVLILRAVGTTSGVVDDVSIHEAGAMSISVNGSTAVETTGIAYTGAGVTAMVLGARNSAGTDPAVRFTAEPIQANRRYITGAALQALSV